MSQFNYADYQGLVDKAQSGDGSKVGYFKLKDDGDEALVRFNCPSVESLQFASVHTVQADGKWMKVSCLNPLGNYNDTCPLCTSAKNGNKLISKAGKKVYLQMLCSYKDKATGQFSAAIPVIWERPAAFSKDIANKIKDYSDLRNVVLKITRVGAAGDMKTTYSIDYIPLFDKPELVPLDFSAFDNFNIAKHSYWEKSIDDINVFLTSGKFPEVNNGVNNATANTVTPTIVPQTAVPAYGPQTVPANYAPTTVTPVITPVAPVYAQPAPAATPVAPVTFQQPVQPNIQQPQGMPMRTPMDAAAVPGNPSMPVSPVTPTVPGNPVVPPAAPAAGDRPVRNFSGFAF